MKKSKIATAVVASALTALCCSGMVACGNASGRGEPFVYEYEISVVGGSGGGKIRDGGSCTVTADVPDGKVFEKWVDEYGTVLSAANPYTFDVSGDLELHAVTVDAATCRVEIVGGTITGTDDYQTTVYKGQTVSVTAQSSQSHKFVKWLINGKDESTQNPYVFTATDDISIVAIVDEQYLVAVSGGTVKGEDSSRKIVKGGEKCTIVAYEEMDGLSFAYWYTQDADGNMKRLSYDVEYTFTVTGTEKYYAKYGRSYTVTVENGTIDGAEGNTVKVLDGEGVTVRFDPTSVTGDQKFGGWIVDDEVVSTEKVFTINKITENTVISANLVVKYLAAPKMNDNQMLRCKENGTLELDRGGETAFTGDVDHIMFYLYTSPYADKDDYVGRMKFLNEGGEWRLATADGTRLWGIEGSAGNFWLDTKEDFNKDKHGNTMKMIAKCVGEGYNANTPYYFAAQAVAKEDSQFNNSPISVIGPQAFIENNVAKHTVTVEGGIVVGANLSRVEVYEGQEVTVYSDSDVFAGWQIGDEIVSENPLYTFTVSADVNIVATYNGKSTITVDGGIIKGGSAVGQFDAGEECTVVANPAESGKTFAYWYILDGDNETILSKDSEYTFNVSRTLTVYAKYGNICTVTVVGGTVDGMDKAEDGRYEVVDLNEYTVELDLDAIPDGKGFVGWKLNGETVSSEYTYKFASGTLSDDAVIAAEYQDKVYEFNTPVMNANQTFRIRHRDGNADDYAIEIDRGGSTVFTAHADYVRFYIYTSPYANKNTDSVGSFVLKRDGADAYITSEDGKRFYKSEGNFGNLWLETSGEYNKPSTKTNFFKMWREILGDAFDSNTPYYIAAQVCGKDGSIYGASEISVIGPQAIIENNNVAQHAVTVKGGVVKGTQTVSLKVYDGQTVTVEATSDKFKYWLVNGVQSGSDMELTVTVTGDTSIVAVLDGECNISVEGGTVNGGKTSVTVNNGESITVTAAAPEAGKAFAYWYVLEDGKEKILSRDAVYTFDAEASIVLKAKYVTTYTLTVEGGIIDGLEKNEDGTYTVSETGTYTLKLDLDAIPDGKGFTKWQMDGADFSTDMTVTIAGGGALTGNATIVAVYADQVHEFTKPVNDQNQMFKVNASETIEIDRKNKGVQSEFDNANIAYMMFYFYTSPYVQATAENAVGSIKLVRDGDKFRFEAMDGSKLWDVKGRKSDLYQDNAQEAGCSSKKEMLFKLIKSAAGANFDANTPYYVAMQSFGKAGSIYAPSEISAIGPQAYIYNNVEQFTVTITGGKIENTELSTATFYKGQSVTIVPSFDNFEKWVVNGTDVTDSTYTFTVNAETTVTAVYGGQSTVTVEGGTLSDGGTSGTVANGDNVTVTANEAAAGTYFAYWYTDADGAETILSRDGSYTFKATADITVKAKFGNIYKITVNGGVLEDATANDDGTFTVRQFDEYVLKLAVAEIPDGKGFTQWKIGETVVSESFEYTFASGYFNGDTTVDATYADKVSVGVDLTMTAKGNAMMWHDGSYIIDIDRCLLDGTNKSTAFANNVDHVKMYIYTSTSASKDDYVGILVIDRKCERNNDNGHPLRFATVSGETLWRLEGIPANTWISTIDNYAGPNGAQPGLRSVNFRNMLKKCIELNGGTYDDSAKYYLAAQACGAEGSVHGDGEISEIGTCEF